MFKKFLSVILSISMLLSLVMVTNVFASTTLFSEIDLSSKNIGDSITSHGGYGTKATVVQEDGEKAVVIAPNLTQYSVNGSTVKLLNYTGAKGSDYISTVDPKGIILESTLKIKNKVGALHLVTNTSNPTTRYLTLTSGVVYYSEKQNTTKLSTGLIYPINTWFTIKLSWNNTTGYVEISVKNLSTGAETKKTLELTNWVKSSSDLSAVKTFSWYHEGTDENYTYIRKLQVHTENDASAIAPPPPSRMVVRDDFDSNESNIAAPWTSTTIPVQTTDRGKSAVFGSSGGTSMTVSNADGILNSAAKGLVVEFSTKLTYTSTSPNFIVSVDGSWSSPGNKIMQFRANRSQVDRDGSDNTADTILNGWSKDKWYDVRIEISFDSAGSASYRYIVYDGTTETVKVFEDVSTTLFDDPSSITKVQFTYATGDGKAYVDNVNVYWLDSESASGISKSTASTSVNINLENYDEGDVDECKEAFSTYAGTASYTVESVKNSGRGKSLKISTDNASSSYEFYKDFLPIQNGIMSFDIMFPEIKGETIIQTQKSTANNNYGSTFMFLRFDKWGNVEDGAGQTSYGTYEAGRWYKLIITAGSYSSGEGYQHFELVDDTGAVITEKTISLGKHTTADSFIPYDSVRGVRLLMAEGPHSIFIDNFKSYAPALTPFGIYPVGQNALKENIILNDSKFILHFSKPVDITKSEFKVNGEAVTAAGYDYVTLNTELEAGNEYEIEYTVYDLDGFKTEGYISGISCEAIFNVSSFEAASLASPAATASVKTSTAASSKEVKLFVAAYSDGEMVALDCDTKTIDATGASFAASVDASGADEVKTFLWDGETLTPIK